MTKSLLSDLIIPVQISQLIIPATTIKLCQMDRKEATSGEDQTKFRQDAEASSHNKCHGFNNTTEVILMKTCAIFKNPITSRKFKNWYRQEPA